MLRLIKTEITIAVLSIISGLCFGILIGAHYYGDNEKNKCKPGTVTEAKIIADDTAMEYQLKCKIK